MQKWSQALPGTLGAVPGLWGTDGTRRSVAAKALPKDRFRPLRQHDALPVLEGVRTAPGGPRRHRGPDVLRGRVLDDAPGLVLGVGRDGRGPRLLGADGGRAGVQELALWGFASSEQAHMVRAHVPHAGRRFRVPLPDHPAGAGQGEAVLQGVVEGEPVAPAEALSGLASEEVRSPPGLDRRRDRRGGRGV